MAFCSYTGVRASLHVDVNMDTHHVTCVSSPDAGAKLVLGDAEHRSDRVHLGSARCSSRAAIESEGTAEVKKTLSTPGTVASNHSAPRVSSIVTEGCIWCV